MRADYQTVIAEAQLAPHSFQEDAEAFLTVAEHVIKQAFHDLRHSNMTEGDYQSARRFLLSDEGGLEGWAQCFSIPLELIRGQAREIVEQREGRRRAA